MNILMLTNTFTPHVGGVARSVETFTAGYRALGQRVLVLAPRFEGMPESERDVIRVPLLGGRINLDLAKKGLGEKLGREVA